MDETKKERVIRRFNHLETRRGVWEDAWEDIGKYINPRRETMRPNNVRGERYGKYIYDTTAPTELHNAADGTQGNMVSDSFRWFTLGISGMKDFESYVAQGWLQDVEDGLYAAFQRSNFYNAMNEYLLDGFSIGTATMYVEENIRAGRIVFRTLHPREVYIAENRFGEVDTHFRKFQMTAINAVEEFGGYDEKLSLLAEKEPETPVTFLHAVYPRKQYDPHKSDSVNMPFESVYLDLDRSIEVRVGGYKFSPYITWRFRKNSDEEYGRSPSWEVLRDVKILNAMSKDLMTAAQKSVDPAKFAPEEFKNIWDFNPGTINYYRDTGRQPMPFNDTNNFPVALDREEQRRQAIRDAFRSNIFMMLANDKRVKTATEAVEMQNEKLSMLSSTVGRFQSESLSPIIETVFQIESAAGRIAAPPQEAMLGGKEMNIDYIGPLAQAQKRLSSAGTKRAIQEVAGLWQIDPTSLDYFDIGEAAKIIAESEGIDIDILRDTKKVAMIRKQRAEAQQQAQQQQQMIDIAKSNSVNEPVQDQSILSRMLGG